MDLHKYTTHYITYIEMTCTAYITYTTLHATEQSFPWSAATHALLHVSQIVCCVVFPAFHAVSIRQPFLSTMQVL